MLYVPEQPSFNLIVPPCESLFDYGRTGLPVELPDDRGLAPWPSAPRSSPRRPRQAIAEELAQPIGSSPLAALARGRKNALHFRLRHYAAGAEPPDPAAAAAHLEDQGIARRDILILIATGLHRPNEGAELVELPRVGHCRTTTVSRIISAKCSKSTTTSALRRTACRSISTAGMFAPT